MILEKKIPFKYLVSIVKYDLIISLFVIISSHSFAVEFMNSFPAMPLAIPAFLGTSLSVLLSFKMNQSYDRWWEARKAWGAVVNDSRSLVMQLRSFAGTAQMDLVKKISHRQIAWSYITGQTLRKTQSLNDISHWLPQEDISKLQNHPGWPILLLQLTSDDIAELRARNALDVHTHIHLQETIVRLTDSLGTMERINRTIFPSTYRLVLHFIIYLFIVTMSISLKEINSALVIPLLLLISAGFLLVEKIAYQLQDPFKDRPSDVPITDIAENIEDDIRRMMGEAPPLKKPSVHKYYVK